MENYSRFLDTAVRAALNAGRIQKERLGSSFELDFKGESDIVTAVDTECEEAIKGIIFEDWPKHSVLAEESGASGSGEYQWVVDPLDGTNNYAHSYPHFSSSVALLHKDEVIAGAVYDPILEELFTAVKGGGAYLNGNTLRTSQVKDVDRAILATGFPYDHQRRMKEALPYFVAMLSVAQGIRRSGSAALDLCYVAAGRVDGFWEVSLHPWDVAAGWLIVEEAGGKITGLDGKPATLHSEQILASNGPLHAALSRILANPE